MRHMLFMPSTELEKAVGVGWVSRAQGGFCWAGSVRPKIWRVSRRAGREIWKVGSWLGLVSSAPFSESESERCELRSGGGARKV